MEMLEDGECFVAVTALCVNCVWQDFRLELLIRGVTDQLHVRQERAPGPHHHVKSVLVEHRAGLDSHQGVPEDLFLGNFVFLLDARIFSPGVGQTSWCFLGAHLAYILKLHVSLDFEELCKFVGGINIEILMVLRGKYLVIILSIEL